MLLGNANRQDTVLEAVVEEGEGEDFLDEEGESPAEDESEGGNKPAEDGDSSKEKDTRSE